MRDLILKTLVPTAIAILTAIGGCNLQFSYERGKSKTTNQEAIKTVAISFAKMCNK